MNKKFPIICPKGSKVVITQRFKPLNNPTHDAVDFIIQNPNLQQRENQILTFGSQLVCPVVEAKCVLLNDFGAMNDKGNGCDIEWSENGFYWRLHFWHTVYNELILDQVVKEGQIVALMGNSGNCSPMPTIQNPYQGSHVHCRFSRYKKSNLLYVENGKIICPNYEIVSLNMLDYFDVNNPYQGKDSSVEVDLEPPKYFVNKIGASSVWGKLKVVFLKLLKR